jgi:hypothetical protein
MNLYRDGQYVEHYKGSRDLHLLQEYISKHARPTAAFSFTVTPTSTPSTSTATRHANPLGTVLILDTETFNTVREGPVFIKFFAPWYENQHLAGVISFCTKGVDTARNWRQPGHNWPVICKTS